MTRFRGPAPDSWSFLLAGGLFRSAGGLTGVAYAGLTGSTLADIRVDDGTDTPGAPFPGSAVTIDSVTSAPPLFWFPDGDVSVVYMSVNGGPRTPVYANYDPRINAKVGKGDLLINAKDYGTVGDDTADDTAAIVAALAAAAVTPKKTVYLPPGTYKHTGFSVTASMHGSPLGKTVLHGPQITMSTSNVEIVDLKIQSTTATAVISAHATDIKWRRVEVTHDASLSSHLAWDIFDIDRFRVIDCKFGIGGLQLSGCDDFLIDGNWWDCQYLNTNEPCHISGQSSGQFVNNTVTRTATDAVDLYSSGHRCVIANNRFIGLQGGAGLECKVTMSDIPGNSAGPGNKFESTIIANNVFYDFNCDTNSTRFGIYATYIDSRAVKAFTLTETNAAIIIKGNVIDGFNMTDPGNGAIVSYWPIVYTGHNGIIDGNIIRHVRAWNNASPAGMLIAGDAAGVIDGQKCVRTQIRGNTIVGIEGTQGTGIRAGNLDYCTITDNIIGTDDETGITTKLGIDAAAGATWNQCTISGNVFHCNNSLGFAIRAAATTITLNECVIAGNVLRDCGVMIYKAVRCTFSANSFNNALNSGGFQIGNTGTTSTGCTFVGNQFTMSSDNILLITNMTGFIIDGNVFKSSLRPIFLFNSTTNGVVSNNLSFTQGIGTSVVAFDASVTAPDQATTYIDTNTNKILP